MAKAKGKPAGVAKGGKSPLSVTFVGTGYVGLCTAVAFATKGIRVVCVDVVPEKVKLINSGKSPIYEIGLDALLQKALKGKMLRATTDLASAVAETDISFLCVQTPSMPGGEIELKYIKEAAAGVGKALAAKTGWHTVVVKSTVLPNTTAKIVGPILERESGKTAHSDFGLGMTPEFLREGCALTDSLNPDRVVIGAQDDRTRKALHAVFDRFGAPVLDVAISTAEMIKYASNSFLAARISLTNEISTVCELYGIDVYEVMKGVGMDKRIGPLFLNAGAGFGGSCFPKDTKAILSDAKRMGFDTRIIRAVLDVNDRQAVHLVDIAQKALGSLSGKRVALLGLAFKPDTDDVRETRAYPVAKELFSRGASVVAYDPQAAENFRKEYELSGVEYAKSARECIREADCCIVQVDWAEFGKIKPSEFKSLLARPVLIDGRRTFDPAAMEKAGVRYHGIGWKKNP